MGKGSLLTLSIHAFVCGKQALAVRASGLASFLDQNAGRTSRHSQVSMNRTGRSRNSAGFSPGVTLDASFQAVRRFGHVVSCLGWGTHALGPLSFRAATYSGVFTLLPLLTGARWAEGRYERFAAFTRELVDGSPWSRQSCACSHFRVWAVNKLS
jgi:hypothetical protein